MGSRELTDHRHLERSWPSVFSKWHHRRTNCTSGLPTGAVRTWMGRKRSVRLQCRKGKLTLTGNVAAGQKECCGAMGCVRLQNESSILPVQRALLAVSLESHKHFETGEKGLADSTRRQTLHDQEVEDDLCQFFRSLSVYVSFFCLHVLPISLSGCSELSIGFPQYGMFPCQLGG